MPFHIRSNNPLIRIASAVVMGISWWAVLGATAMVVIPFFGTFDTQAFLTGAESKANSEITGFEFILVLATMLAAYWLFEFLFRRFSKFLNRKLNKNIKWQNTPMG